MKLKNIVAAVLLTAASTAMAADCTPRYVFYFIGDGMGLGPVGAAQTYLREKFGEERHLLLDSLEVMGWCKTYSASSPVTDSAAAGTALSTGTKTKNGMLGMNPDTVAVTSVAAQLFDRGYGVGLVTSVAPDDATPGAFYAHVPSRKMYYTIGTQMARSGYQFVAGSGLRGIWEDGRDTDLLSVFAENDVQLLYGAEGIDRISSEKVLLLGPEDGKDWSIGYTVDSIPGALNLPQMTRACLRHLEQTSPDGFFMMVEGGNIDHALHGNDGGAALKEILNFNDAVRVGLEFYRAHPEETLVIVTADHDTGGMALSNNAKDGLLDVDYQKVSKEVFSDYCKSLLRSRNIYTWDDMKEYLNHNMGLFGAIPVSADDEERLHDMFDRTFELRNTSDQETLYANFNSFAVEVFRLFNNHVGFAFTTTGHSGNPVPLCASGCGADMFKGVNNNIDIPERIRALMLR